MANKMTNPMKGSTGPKTRWSYSGFYEAETSRTLDRSGGDPTCNQGGICVVEPVAFTQNQRDEVRDLGEKSAALAAEPGMKQQTFVLQGNMIGRKDENGPQGDGVNEDVCFTLDATDRHAGEMKAYISPSCLSSMATSATSVMCCTTVWQAVRLSRVRPMRTARKSRRTP